MLRFPLVSAACIAVSVANLTILTLSFGLWQPPTPAPRRRAATGVATAILLSAMLITVGLMTQGLGGSGTDEGSNGPRTRNHHSGPLDSARTVMREFFGKDSRETPAAPNLGKNPDPAQVLGPDFLGVILWPEISPVTLLIAPRLGGGAFVGSQNPLSIPFGGEYWMYLVGESRPPAGSYFQRASPAALTFRTINHDRLIMEARQKLEQEIDISCCSEVRLAVLNAQAGPGTVCLELVLMEGEPPRVKQQSLGELPVRSASLDSSRPVEEMLRFPVRSGPFVFDQLLVKYDRDGSRRDKSARIAIKRFILVPRS
jgi:hypothetical protein